MVDDDADDDAGDDDDDEDEEEEDMLMIIMYKNLIMCWWLLLLPALFDDSITEFHWIRYILIYFVCSFIRNDILMVVILMIWVYISEWWSVEEPPPKLVALVWDIQLNYPKWFTYS